MFAPLGEQFDLGGSLTYVRHQYEFDNATANIVDGNDMDTAPHQIASVRLSWNFKPPKSC
jgi:outer membrane receptor protein involved in Fe transport